MEDPRGARPPAATAADDPAIVAGCRAGDATSLERFFVTHVHYVERVISRLTGPTPDLEDLVQTTFIQAFQSFGRYRGEASLKTWVTRIAVHTALHQLRSGVRRAVPLELVADADEPNDPAEPADQQAANRQLARRLHALLDRVSPKKRVAFLLYTVEDYSIEEVAALTESSKAATKSRIWFARRELMAMARGQADLRQLIEASGAQSWR
ncbi:MAG TPA: RNA polymerase sigma factor [Polyangia bacterium]|nr:RNA polymerase sigma factor [Polyangia bacterium]